MCGFIDSVGSAIGGAVNGIGSFLGSPVGKIATAGSNRCHRHRDAEPVRHRRGGRLDVLGAVGAR